MATIGEKNFLNLFSKDVSLMHVEPHIYSVFTNNEVVNTYNKASWHETL